MKSLNYYVPPPYVNWMNSVPLVEIVVVAVKFLPNNCLYLRTQGVPTMEYPYRLNGFVPIPI